MTPEEFKSLREKIGLSRSDFAAELGYVGHNRASVIADYESGRKAPIPTYIARLTFLLVEHFDAEQGHFPLWPQCCAHNPRPQRSPNGGKR